MRGMKRWITAMAIAGWAGAAPAALVNLGDGTVKDTDTQLVWLHDWSTVAAAPWATQRDWADGLSFAGSSDWRLPSYDEFMALATTHGNPMQLNVFTNVVDGSYWTRDESGPSATYFVPAWSNGAIDSKDFELWAVAVRVDSTPSPVPAPPPLALALAALGAALVARRAAPTPRS